MKCPVLFAGALIPCYEQQRNKWMNSAAPVSSKFTWQCFKKAQTANTVVRSLRYISSSSALLVLENLVGSCIRQCKTQQFWWSKFNIKIDLFKTSFDLWCTQRVSVCYWENGMWETRKSRKIISLCLCFVYEPPRVIGSSSVLACWMKYVLGFIPHW